MRSPIITLSAADCERAASVALERQRMAVERGRPPRNRAPTDSHTALAMHALGTEGELAVKRWLDPIHWNALQEDVSDLPDLGENIDVKSVTRAHDRLLIGLEKGRPDWVYVLARNLTAANWHVWGWIDGATALARRDWIISPNANRPCIAVPNVYLAPPRELWDYVERWIPADRK